MYPDYRVPSHLKPSAPTAREETRLVWVLDLVRHWELVHLDLAERYGVDLHDPHVLARPWPGVRMMMWSLVREPSRLSQALRQEVDDAAPGS